MTAAFLRDDDDLGPQKGPSSVGKIEAEVKAILQAIKDFQEEDVLSEAEAALFSANPANKPLIPVKRLPTKDEK